MKKLMIAVAIVCAAAFAEAGSVKWGLAGVDAPDSGYAYLINSSDVGYVDVATIVAAINDGSFATTYAANAVKATDFEDGEIDLGNVVTGITGSQTYWMIALDDDSSPTLAFVGEEVTQTIGSSGQKTYQWDFDDNTSAWTAVSVPEPTSGLLMLLGVAGLALRRKRA